MKIRSAIHIIVAALAACFAPGRASATVTTGGWWHYGEVSDYYADSSGNSYRFQMAFSCVGSGQAGAVIVPFGVGGPLGPSGFISTNSLLWGAENCSAAGMWDPGNSSVPSYNPPATNYGIELWVLPVANGVLGGNSTWIFGTGSGTSVPTGKTQGGVSFVLTKNGDGTSSITANIIPSSGSLIPVGDPLPANTNQWTHLAIVNDNGTTTFYVNGLAHGAADTTHATVSEGQIFAGSSPGTTPTFDGYLDELRIFTFAPGQFATTDLLLRPLTPNILSQPQPATVTVGGAAPFSVSTAFDTSTTYQWDRNGVPIAGATNATYAVPVVALTDSGALFSCAVSNSLGGLVTSNVALTVVPLQTANVNYYRAAVQAESSLVAYFPVDGDTGATLTNTVDATHNGALEGNAGYDGRTDRSYGERALRLNGDGDVTVPNNPAYEFASGNGTIEALIHLLPATAPGNETLFSLFGGTGIVYYNIAVSPDGSSVVFTSDALTTPLTWAVPVPLLNRTAHFAMVFTNGTATPYVDGLPLGTKANATFGASVGLPAYIGSTSLASPGVWTGTIDEFAIYQSALSANTVAIHNSRFLFGTSVTGPSILTSPAGTRTLLAGGSPTFTVTAAGTAPLSYQWLYNGVVITNATSSTLTLQATTTNSSGNYSVQVSNPVGLTNSVPFTLAFVPATDRYSKIVMNDNPSAYWRLDETSGTNAIDSAGGHDGVYSGSLTLGATGALPGISDTAVHFGGSSGVVKVPFTPVLNPSTPFSVEFWANPDNHNTYVPMGSQYRNGAGRSGWAFYMENDGNGWEIQMGDTSGVHADAVAGSSDVPGRWDHLVAVWDGTNSVTLYVDGVVAAQASGNYVPNGIAPWVIGQRNDGNFGFDGTIDEVAFYNYSLSAVQVSNHFEVSYVASTVTAEPAGVTNATEPQTITLTAGVTGFPNTYQWLLNGTNLVATTNFDGSAHYPNGVNSSNLVIAEANPSDSGNYELVVSNPLGGSTTVPVKVTVAPDNTPPAVAYASGQSSTNRVRVAFNKAVTPATASVAANYKLSGGVSVTNVVLVNGSLTIVNLETTGLTPNTNYTLTVTGVTDAESQHTSIGTNTVSFKTYVVTHGVLAWDFYANIAGASVASLTGDPQWPDGVYTNSVLTNFSTMSITGGTLSDNPLFGSLGDNYGDHVYGWVTPAVSTNYTFFLRSDDASELWLSPDANPADANLIAAETGCCNPFEEPTNNSPTQTSFSMPLTAGTSYYIEAFHKQGGGGDYVEVAWRQDNDPTPAANLQPIPGSVLSAYAPVVGPVFNPPTLGASGQVTITWQGSGTLQQSTDLQTWSNVTGNPASGYVVTPSAGGHQFYRLVQ